MAIILFLLSAISIQAKTLKGKVIDANTQKPLLGVNIQVLHSSMSTNTDLKGEFTLAGVNEKSTLVVTYIGYKPETLAVGKNDYLLIKLVSQKTELEEITIQKNETKHQVTNMISLDALGEAAPMSNQLMGRPVQPHYADAMPHNTEEYDVIQENSFHRPEVEPLSTFSIDVDAASYSNLRRVINYGTMPQKDMVRIEEMVNYFSYDYPEPEGDQPFSITTEISKAPWNEKHRLVHIGLQGKNLNYEELQPTNLVFLIDVSGSMGAPNKLPLLKSSLKMLVNELKPHDRIAIVVYAGAAGLVLPSTPAKEKEKIIAALDRLSAGGSTAGGAGIKLAYEVAKENIMVGGNNRVILATDGDFNVGVSSTAAMVELIEEKRKDGIFLTITGFGMGNYKDGRMEQISNAGNGNYYYIDNIREAEKVFVKEMRATLFTIAKDVKIQVEFNPTKVQAYRLIGYENRMLNAEDFNDDKKDAGELGAGHTVTALYEVIPVGVTSEFVKSVDKLKYQVQKETLFASAKEEILTVKFRYKQPDGTTSKLIVQPLLDKEVPLLETSNNFKFSAAVAEFGMLLRQSEFAPDADYNRVISMATSGKGRDENEYRAQFIQLVRSCQLLASKN